MPLKSFFFFIGSKKESYKGTLKNESFSSSFSLNFWWYFPIVPVLLTVVALICLNFWEYLGVICLSGCIGNKSYEKFYSRIYHIKTSPMKDETKREDLRWENYYNLPFFM